MTWLLLGLSATAALAAFGDPAGTRTTGATGETPAAVPRLRMVASRHASPGEGGDPFGLAPLPLVSQPLPAVPPAPTIVTLPAWRVIGKQAVDGEGWTVFLASGEMTRVVRTGDTLDDAFRVVAIEPPTMTLQHLARKTRITFEIGEAKE